MRTHCLLLPAAARCDVELHQAFRAGHARANGAGREVRHGVTSGDSCDMFDVPALRVRGA